MKTITLIVTDEERAALQAALITEIRDIRAEVEINKRAELAGKLASLRRLLRAVVEAK